LFGVIAAGGTLGALVGPALAGLLVTRIGNAGILYLAACGFLAAIVCQRVLVKLWYAKPAKAPTSSSEDSVPRRNDEGLGGNPFAGIFIVLKSRYLLGIASFVVLLSLVNTVLYFEQLRIVSETFVDREQRTQVFALLDVIVQSLTIFAQLFFTGRIATRLGVGALLTIVPAVLAVGFLMLLAFNVFGMIAVLLVMRRWGEYAFIRPGREMLWSTLDTESKYKAKSFIDLPVYRAADYIGAQAKTALDASGSSPASVALVGAGLAVLWVLNGAWLGRQYRRQEPSS
jgi:AAA family ATP:ADP antiporter